MEEIIMSKIIRYIIVVFVIILICIIGVTIVVKKNNKIVKNSQDGNISYIEYEDYNELALKLAEKNGDWSRYRLCENFRKKYNEKDGIFGKMQFDKVEYRPFHDGKYSFEEYPYLVVTQGSKKTAYMFSLYEALNGYDIQWTDKIEITDENGNELEGKIKVDGDSFVRAMQMLAWGYEQEECIGKTEKFKEKYPYFLDLFIHYSPLEFNQITFLDELSSFEKNEAYFEVDSNLECKKRTYIVKLILDKFNFIDDADVKLINEVKYNKYEQSGGLYIFYKNSDWNDLWLTDSFKKKYNSLNGVFPEIDKLGNNFSFNTDFNMYNQISIDGIASINQIREFIINKNKCFYLYEVYIKDNKYIDDVIYKKLPYDSSMTLEEVRNAYIRDYVEKN